MGIIVCKFGGTSVAGPDMFKRVLAILRADSERRYAVLSAPGRDGKGEKVTDLLYKGDLDGAAARFETIARELGIHMDFRGELERAARVSEATLVSRGETLCARLFSAYSGLPFADAAALIRFDEGGRLVRNKTLRALNELSRRCPRAVIPGFYGAGPKGEIVTFPRNGSDITGALVAAGVGASLYENWTDVPGLMTGDPDADPNAKVIPEISYPEMRALCACGARVLHPDCLDAVARAGIPTRIRCTTRPDLPGTLVH